MAYVYHVREKIKSQVQVTTREDHDSPLGKFFIRDIGSHDIQDDLFGLMCKFARFRDSENNLRFILETDSRELRRKKITIFSPKEFFEKRSVLEHRSGLIFIH